MAAAAASIPCAILGSSRYLQVGCLSLGDEGSSLRPSRIPRLRPRRTRQWTRARTRPDHGASEARRSSGDAPEDSPEDSPERRTSFAFGVLAGCCVAMTALLVTCEWALRVTGASAPDLQLDAFARLAGPLSSLVWWAGIFSVVYLTQGGFVDPIRADMVGLTSLLFSLSPPLSPSLPLALFLFVCSPQLRWILTLGFITHSSAHSPLPRCTRNARH